MRFAVGAGFGFCQPWTGLFVVQMLELVFEEVLFVGLGEALLGVRQLLRFFGVML
jgi:hypothetical protein